MRPSLGAGGLATPPLTILDAMRDPALFGPWFTPDALWAAWQAFLAALFGLPMSEDQLALYRRHTGRHTPPGRLAREAWLVVGRRGGKSRIAALVAVYLACFRPYRPGLAPGERATVMVIAADRRQARVVLRYIAGFFDHVPLLQPLVERRTAEALHLFTGVTVEVHTGSFRAVRGYTVAAAICDEIAFWRAEDSANPDTEILNGLRPGMATVPGALLLCISSPYARRGALWEAYRAHYGQDGDPVLIWQADTGSMNPTVDAHTIEAAYDADPAVAAAEYGAEFRGDIESFVAREAVEAGVVPGRFELPPVSSLSYTGFVDPAGGSGGDSMTLAIAHAEPQADRQIGVLDLLREARPPFSPEQVVAEYAALLKTYRVTRVVGDRYAGEWPREQFRKLGIQYEAAAQAKSELYRDLLPLLNSRAVDLLDHSRLIAQLCGLERRTARGGRDSIDHAPGAHDDLPNAAAGALVAAVQTPAAPLFAFY